MLVVSLSLTPAASHFTVGDSKPSYPFVINNYYPHVSGPLGYVWPGGGLIGQGTVDRPDAPGYQPPWPRYPAWMMPRSSWLQLEGTSYAPFGAILTSTDGHVNKGDLLFGINYSQPTKKQSYIYLWIWIPPEFTGISTSKVVTTITNVYDQIWVDTQFKENPTGPYWTRIRITADSDHLITFTPSSPDRWYYVQLNDIGAPTIAGRYFFKIALSNSSDVLPATNDMIPTENWPVLMLKGEVDPAVIWGTIRYGGWNASLYGQPIRLPGRVRAVGIADDPYTGKSTGRHVEARGYFNHTAQGHYEVEGVAPGVYDLYASAAGYPERMIAVGVKIRKGQSLQVDGYLIPGFTLRGLIFSKCGTGEVPWFYDKSPIKIEIYSNKKDAEDTSRDYWETAAVAWSWYGPDVKQFPWWGLTDGDYPKGSLGIDSNGVGPAQNWVVSASKTSFSFQFGEEGKYGVPSELDGHIPQRYATWINGLSAGTYYVKAFTYGYVQVEADGVTFQHAIAVVPSVAYPGNVFLPFDLRLSSIIEKTVHLHDQRGTMIESPLLTSRYLYAEARDNTGSIVAWKVQLVPAGSTSVVIALHGFLDQTYGSGWGRNYGIKAGTYTIRTYMYGYISPSSDIVTIGLCGSRTQISNHLYKGVSFNLTVYSKDWEKPRNLRPWVWDGEPIYVQITDGLGRMIDYRKIYQDKLKTYANTGVYSGSEASSATNYDVGYYPISFNDGLYKFRVLTYGYVQKKEFSVHALAQNVTADIALEVVIGANITVTMKFRHEAMFSHLIANSSVRLRLFDDAGNLVGEWLTSNPKTPFLTGTERLNYVPFCTSTFTAVIAGLPSVYNPDPYFAFGYNLTRAAPYGIDAYPNYKGGWAIEVEVVPWYGDYDGNGLAEFFPWIPGILHGESPKYIPENHVGPYALRYKALVPNTHLGGEASVIIALDQLGLLYGNIYTYTYCDDLRTTSWVTVSVKGASETFRVYSFDGVYAIWLNPGDYTLTIVEWTLANEGHRTQTTAIHVSDGQKARFDAYLEQSSIPIPEQITNGAIAALILVTCIFMRTARSHRSRRTDRKGLSDISVGSGGSQK